MIYTCESRVRYSEIGEDGNMTLFSLFNNFQDCCIFHGEDAGVGLQYNTERGQAWIIANLQAVIRRMPRFGEYIRVTTWADGFRGIIAHRNFSIESAEGELLAEAGTEWLFMNLTSRRPIRIPAEQGTAYGLHPEKKLTCDPGHRKIRMPEGGTQAKAFEIREQHLDTNGHVNNAQYVRMAMPYLPAHLAIHRLRVEYRMQAMLGDVIVPRHVETEDGNACYVELANEAGEAFFVGEFIE